MVIRRWVFTLTRSATFDVSQQSAHSSIRRRLNQWRDFPDLAGLVIRVQAVDCGPCEGEKPVFDQGLRRPPQHHRHRAAAPPGMQPLNLFPQPNQSQPGMSPFEPWHEPSFRSLQYAHAPGLGDCKHSSYSYSSTCVDQCPVPPLASPDYSPSRFRSVSQFAPPGIHTQPILPQPYSNRPSFGSLQGVYAQNHQPSGYTHGHQQSAYSLGYVTSGHFQGQGGRQYEFAIMFASRPPLTDLNAAPVGFSSHFPPVQPTGYRSNACPTGPPSYNILPNGFSRGTPSFGTSGTQRQPTGNTKHRTTPPRGTAPKKQKMTTAPEHSTTYMEVSQASLKKEPSPYSVRRRKGTALEGHKTATAAEHGRTADDEIPRSTVKVKEESPPCTTQRHRPAALEQHTTFAASEPITTETDGASQAPVNNASSSKPVQRRRFLSGACVVS